MKRWLASGWGSTVGQVASMLSKVADLSLAVLIVQGNAAVSAGGLYTPGAGNHILKSAVEGAVSQLRAGMTGANPAADRR